MKYEIKNSVLCVTAEEYGAEPVSVRYAGKERLWQNDNGSWAGHAPVLFPVCGHCGITVNGVKYPIGAHGFARKSNFKLRARGEDFLVFLLRANEETKKVYPYDFELTVRYTLRGNTLTVSYEVYNAGAQPLYFACGGHPSFALDGALEEYRIGFDEEEHMIHCAHDNHGYLTGERVDLGTGKSLALKEEYFAGGNTLILSDVRSGRVALISRAGEKVAEVGFAGFANLLLWRPEGAGMICIEPWTNLPDVADTEDGEFGKKRGVIEVASEKSVIKEFEISYF